MDGEWIYVEDRTEGRTLEQLGPPMNSKFSMRIEADAMVLVWGHGGRRGDVRVPLDGSVTEVTSTATSEVARYRGEWKDGTFAYEIDFVRKPGEPPTGLIRREFRVVPDGLTVTFRGAVGLYRHAEDIPMPTPAEATIDGLAWLAGAWTGTRGSEGQISFEERWSPPLGGSMFATSRTVTRGKMSAFEYLRIVERDGGLIYIAQPNGAAATEFVLTEVSPARAVFENPRHDYPKRIVYEVSESRQGVRWLTATIGFTKGGTPRRFEFTQEAGGE
ncbi:MAG: hypothetical protein C0513_07600 [Isosphaera sp.]|nr:hypothetical protein [Isosphaera sp.]